MIFSTNIYAQAGFSEVNNEIFDKAHLRNIQQAGTLHYKYQKEHFVDGSRQDTVDLVLSNLRNTGRKDTHIDFFTGPYNRPYQDRENQQGNTVAVFFLEFDVREMGRLFNKGNNNNRWHYLQKKLKWALAKGASKKEIDIEYNGQTVKGVQYTVQPYINDPKKSEFPLYASKYYIFTLSSEIPGEIYQVRTIVPDGATWSEGDGALIDESVTFSSFEAS
ncbi:hypothetical protein N9Y67_04315 [Pseudomonadota bacterium]|nr:hypothetical protein [Pseudomonadota bacterium]